MRRRCTPLALAGALAVVGCERGGSPVVRADPVHVQEVEVWRAERRERLLASEGWLSLVGLFWLDEGDNAVGSAAAAKIRLPASAPAALGVLVRRGQSVSGRFDPEAGATVNDAPVGEVSLVSDAAGPPTTVRVGRVRFFVIDRGGRLGVRVKDEAAPTRQGFAGLAYFPIDTGWRLRARFVPYAPPKHVLIPTVLDTTEAMLVPGALEMDSPAGPLRLDAILEPESDELFLIFADATTGKETYPAGRFLYTPKPACLAADGTGCPAAPAVLVSVDFNRAYNPPCAFTPFATCPLPPPQNRLRLALRAGELAYRGAGH